MQNDSLNSSHAAKPRIEQTKSSTRESSTPPALAEYRDFPERPVKLIASKHGLAPATLLHQARKANLARRKRGRRHHLEPTAVQLKMIEMYGKGRGYLIAQEFGVSRQRVHQILKRWQHLLPEPSIKESISHAQSRVRCPRERKETVVSFRLTNRQIARAKELLRSLGVSPRVSNSKACHVIFLATLGGYSPMPPIFQKNVVPANDQLSKLGAETK
jgi:predicted DNA-binding protein YlxM (UPF0122 family)